MGDVVRIDGPAHDLRHGDVGRFLTAHSRFDFVHNLPVTAEEIRRVEHLVNTEILANVATRARVMNIEDARKILRIIDALEDNDDVQDVYSNVEISDELASQLDA